MPKHSSKLFRDPNQFAACIVAMSTGQEPPAPQDNTENDAEEVYREERAEKAKIKKEKNPTAVALGRLGGMKGRKARAAKLTESRRKEFASQADRKRWEKK